MIGLSVSWIEGEVACLSGFVVFRWFYGAGLVVVVELVSELLVDSLGFGELEAVDGIAVFEFDDDYRRLGASWGIDWGSARLGASFTDFGYRG